MVTCVVLNTVPKDSSPHLIFTGKSNITCFLSRKHTGNRSSWQLFIISQEPLSTDVVETLHTFFLKLAKVKSLRVDNKLAGFYLENAGDLLGFVSPVVHNFIL